MLTCTHCGHTGNDVATEPEYVGGLGYVEVTLCMDRDACWASFDAQHSLVLALDAA